MAYKISGNLSDASKIIIVKESDWSIERIVDEGSGDYTIDLLSSGNKTIISRKSDGEALSFGNVEAASFTETVGDRGFFMGGVTNVIDYITISSLGNAADFGDTNITINTGACAVSNGLNNRAVVNNNNQVLEYFATDYLGNSSSFGNLSVTRSGPSCCSNNTNNRGIFAGGVITDPRSDVIDYFDINSAADAVDFGNLTAGRQMSASTSNGVNNRGITGGGEGPANNQRSTVIDYVTITSIGNSTDFGDLVAGNNGLGACSNHQNNRGVFLGGKIGPSTAYTNVMQYVTITSTSNATDFGDLDVLGGLYMSGTSGGITNRGIIAGNSGAVINNIIEYINITSLGNSQDFGDLTITRTACTTSNA